MSHKTYSSYSTRKTPQSEPIPGRKDEMVQGKAGGYVFPVDDWARLDRFLVLGSCANTYYSSACELTIENADAVMRCIKEDGVRVVERIVEISIAGRAPKNDPALFALAMCAGVGDDATRKAALDALPRVARFSTALYHFCTYVEGFRGWGRGLRRAVASWYNDMDADKLVYQAIKYRQRDGWAHRDLLRLAHPVPNKILHNQIYEWIVDEGWSDEKMPSLMEVDSPMSKIWGFERAKRTNEANIIVELIETLNLPREAIPTQFLNNVDVWGALLKKMPLFAMIRNLGKMSSVGLLKPMSKASAHVIAEVTNPDRIKKARVHPLSVLVALKIYEQGRGFRGKLKWDVVPQIVDALDDAFYLAFGNVEPTGKRVMLALDVSSSMKIFDIAGMPGISPRIGSAAMALVTAKVEPNHMFVGFARSDRNLEGEWSPETTSISRYARYNGIAPLSISPRQRLDDVCKIMADMPFGGTDCALPMMYALENGFEVDAFVIYTDNETWAGDIHPIQALNVYREKTGINAKLVVVGMISSGFSISDPADGGTMDVVGFDVAAPNLISDFISQ